MGGGCGGSLRGVRIGPILLMKSGSYTIRVSARFGRPYAYALALERIVPSSPLATPLCVGCNIVEENNIGPDMDLYIFSGEPESVFSIEISGSSIRGDICVELLAPDGQTTPNGSRRCGERGARIDESLEQSGSYTIIVTEEGLTFPFRYAVNLQCVGNCGKNPPSPNALLENPQPDSFQSGIGLVSGWVCDAKEVLIEVNGQLVRAAYGTTRADTREVCGDTNNGFGLLINWNLLGDGVHRIRAVADGIEFGSASFSVTTIQGEFLSGASGDFVLEDFPEKGTNVVLRWVEALQNFVVVKVVH